MILYAHPIFAFINLWDGWDPFRWSQNRSSVVRICTLTRIAAIVVPMTRLWLSVHVSE